MSTEILTPSIRIGASSARVDGRLKVTGGAQFPSDVRMSEPAFGVWVTSRIAKGVITGFDLTAAETTPGYIDTLTHFNTQGELKPSTNPLDGGVLTLDSPAICHSGQIIGLVLAETFEAAREAAAKINIQYVEEEATSGFGQVGVTEIPVTEINPYAHSPVLGDAHAAYVAAPFKVEAVYETPTQHHNPLELFTITCEWIDGKLVIHEPGQFVLSRQLMADTFGIATEDVRVISRFVGGGFGSKMSGSARTGIVALAAKRLNRPVKLVASRAQGFTIATYRAETRHLVKLAADASGKFAAYVHEGEELTSRASNFSVNGVGLTSLFYDYATIAAKVTLVKADRSGPGFMRAPAELPYMFALESAVDELAYAMDMDPVELRKLNDTQKDPISGRPYSSRSFVQCLEAGAEAFGWGRRDPRPGAMRSGDWRIGYGCAAACFPALASTSSARVVLTPEGARVDLSFCEMGQGAYTVVAHTAAAGLGLPIERVRVAMGDTDLSPGALAGGSMGATSICNAVADACAQILTRLGDDAVRNNDGPLAGADPNSLSLIDGQLVGDAGAEPLVQALARVGGVVDVLGAYAPAGTPAGFVERLSKGMPGFGGGYHGGAQLHCSHGAQFVEVRIHTRTGEIRVARLIGAFAAGTIINARMAQSQLMGGMIWGLSSALHEATEMDPRAARFVNTSFADYSIPVNADIGEVKVIFVPEHDTSLNPLGMKGIGELGIVGVNAALANAVFHATGKRIRRLPIRLEDVI